jgi:hypothetical protein
MRYCKCDQTNLSSSAKGDGFGGLVVSMLASGFRVRGFDPVGFFPM